MHITGHRRTNPIDFGEYRMNSFFTGVQKVWTLQLVESNSLKCSSIQIVRSTELKFSMYITGHCRRNSIDFGEHRKNSFFTGVQKVILIHYDLWSQIL